MILAHAEAVKSLKTAMARARHNFTDMKSNAPFCKALFAVTIRCAVFLGLLSLPTLLSAQTRGKVEVDKNPKVDSLIGNYLVGGKAGNGNTASSDGFRVQIFSGSNRKSAYAAQSKFLDKYPAVPAYVTYREPNFKVHVGDYRSRLEAEKMMDDLKDYFAGLFIIEEKINLPKLDTE